MASPNVENRAGTPLSPQPAAEVRGGWREFAGLLLLALAVAGWAARFAPHKIAEGAPSIDRWGGADFRDAIYYPSLAVQQGVNPYDPSAYQQRYPVGNLFPLYSPALLWLAVPFTWLPLTSAVSLYLLLQIATLVGFCHWMQRLTPHSWSLGTSCALAAAVMLSQPGRCALNAGQLGIVLSFATAVALWEADRKPVASAIGLALATLKPTFGGPLGVTLLLRGEWKTVLLGWGFGALGAVAGAAWIHWQCDVGDPLALLSANQAVLEADPLVNPSTSPIRLDVWALAARVVGDSPAVRLFLTAATLTVGAFAASSKSGGSTAAQARVARLIAGMLGVLVCMYHQIYDAVILAAGLVALWGVRGQGSGRRVSVWLPFCLLLVPCVNVLWTISVQDFAAPWFAWLGPEIQKRAWLLVCSVNPLCLLLCLGWLIRHPVSDD